jgi:hypothetical protein
MAAVSISIQRGSSGQKFTDFTVSTLSPNTSVDIELRFNTTDQAGHNITLKDAVLALELFKQQLLGGKNSAFGHNVLAP